MPRKRRSAKCRRSPVVLAPDCVFYLMLGQCAGVRLRGWPEWFQSWRSETEWRAVLNEAWHRAGRELTAEASVHGFKPHALTHRVPTGDGSKAWKANFLQQHAY